MQDYFGNNKITLFHNTSDTQDCEIDLLILNNGFYVPLKDLSVTPQVLTELNSWVT